MLQVQPITSLDLPELAPYRTMRRQHEHREQGIFVAEGEKVVRRLLESHFGVVSVLLPEKWLHDLEPLLRARPENIAAYIAEKPLLESLTGFSMYQGLLAVGKVPAQPSLDQILERAPRPWLFAAVDGLTSAENLGALVRNCAAFGVHALIVSQTSTSPFLRRAVRSSMGTIFQLPIVEAAVSPRIRSRPFKERAGEKEPCVLLDSLHQLHARGVHCVAAHAHAQGRTLSQANLAGDCCIVFGSEGYGISELALALCHDAVAIPMAPAVDSLNVAAAAAVFLYEAGRQRSKCNA